MKPTKYAPLPGVTGVGREHRLSGLARQDPIGCPSASGMIPLLSRISDISWAAIWVMSGGVRIRQLPVSREFMGEHSTLSFKQNCDRNE